MKQKIFYIVIVICCMSLFSSAKQSGKKCEKKVFNESLKPECIKQAQPKTANEADIDLTPLHLLLFDI